MNTREVDYAAVNSAAAGPVVVIIHPDNQVGEPAVSPARALSQHLQRLLNSWGVESESYGIAEFLHVQGQRDAPPVGKRFEVAVVVDVLGTDGSRLDIPQLKITQLNTTQLSHAQRSRIRGALTGVQVLPIVFSPTAVSELNADRGQHELRSLTERLVELQPASVAAGWYADSDQVTTFQDGGLLFSATAAQTLNDSLRAIPALTTLLPAEVPNQGDSGEITVEWVKVDDERAAPLFANLLVEYSARYANPGAGAELERYPASEFEPPVGAFVILRRGGRTIAGGAIRRYDRKTAEVKRVWTSPEHRRQGLAQRTMVELERAAVQLGYRKIYLTTGSRQPEAVRLYLSAGYQPHFDQNRDPEIKGPLPFTKDLSTESRASGLPEPVDTHTNCVPLAAAVWANRGG